MADPFGKVVPGDKLKMSAALFNGMVDAAVATRRNRFGQSGKAIEWKASPIKVRNTTGAVQGRFAVLGIDVPTIDPDVNEDEFLARVVIDGVTPVAGAHEGLFVVLLEPLADDAIGDAVVSGAVQVQVNVAAGVFGYAEITNGVTDYLVSSASGGARILWMESSGTTRWALVRLGNKAITDPIPVRCASTVAISISSLPATIDGLTMAAGDDFLPTAQTTPHENRPWRYTTAGSAATAMPGASTSADFAHGMTVRAFAGAAIGLWELVTAPPITPGTTGLSWTKLGSSSYPDAAPGVAHGLITDGTQTIGGRKTLKDPSSTYSLTISNSAGDDYYVVGSGGGIAVFAPTYTGTEAWTISGGKLYKYIGGYVGLSLADTGYALVDSTGTFHYGTSATVSGLQFYGGLYVGGTFTYPGGTVTSITITVGTGLSGGGTVTTSGSINVDLEDATTSDIGGVLEQTASDYFTDPSGGGDSNIADLVAQLNAWRDGHSSAGQEEAPTGGGS